MKTKIIVIIFVILLAGCTKKKEHNLEDFNDMLTREEIIERAKKSAISDIVPKERVKTLYDTDNREWKKALNTLIEEDPEAAKEIQSKLKGRCYQAVYVYYDPPMMGGSYWFFVDKETGEGIAGIQD